MLFSCLFNRHKIFQCKIVSWETNYNVLFVITCQTKCLHSQLTNRYEYRTGSSCLICMDELPIETKPKLLNEILRQCLNLNNWRIFRQTFPYIEINFSLQRNGNIILNLDKYCRKMQWPVGTLEYLHWLFLFTWGKIITFN